jgi:hypothetical protein
MKAKKLPDFCGNVSRFILFITWIKVVFTFHLAAGAGDEIWSLKHGDSCRVGALAAKRYREIHDADPPKHPQWVDGVERKVNSYTEADLGMLVSVLHDLGLALGSAASSVASDD